MELLMKLSNNFTLQELTKSQTATRKGIDNEPGTAEIENLIHLAKTILQPVREHFGKPVMISSGYRSPALCEAIGSSAKSQHAKGEAADFEIGGVDNLELAAWIAANCDFDQLILEFYDGVDPNSGWIHCSSKKENSRRQTLKAERIAGRTSYSPILL
jgi:zinc D-Ala-D-Ala carboxypeptidase